MANVDQPRGFVPIRHLSGGQLRVEAYTCGADDTTLISKGDLVTMEADGQVTRSSANDGIAVLGVVAYVEYTDASGKFQVKKQIPATKTSFTDIKIYVYTDPNIVYAVQSDSGTATTDDDVGATANHADTAGSTTTGISAQELDSSDIGTGLQLRILGLYKEPNNAWGEHSVLEVLLSESMARDVTTTI